MTDPIGKKTPLTGTPAAQKPPAPKPADPGAAVKLGTDSFMTTPPTAAQIAQMRAAVAAANALPPMPKDEGALKAWLDQAKPVYEAADKAQRGLGDASFFHKLLPREESSQAFFKVSALGSNVRDAEERLGLRAPTPPADPNRPTFQGTKTVAGWLNNSKNGLAALGSLIALPFVAVVEGADAASRKEQAKNLPAAQAEYEKRLAKYEAEQAKIKK